MKPSGFGASACSGPSGATRVGAGGTSSCWSTATPPTDSVRAPRRSSPSRAAIAAASVRVATPSLPRMFETWTPAVFSLMNRVPRCACSCDPRRRAGAPPTHAGSARGVERDRRGRRGSGCGPRRHRRSPRRRQRCAVSWICTRARRASPSTQSLRGAAPSRSAAAWASASAASASGRGPRLEHRLGESEARVGQRPGDPGTVRGGDGGPPGLGIRHAGGAPCLRPSPGGHAREPTTEAAAPGARPASRSRGTRAAPRARPPPPRPRRRPDGAGEPRRVGLGAGGHGRELEGVEAVLASAPAVPDPRSTVAAAESASSSVRASSTRPR